VLRQGRSLDASVARACGGLKRPDDRRLALAIASETLRWLPDLDNLIDSATKRRLPDDAKARTVLRLALAQVLCLGTPPHAAISTALPLLAGGPRRLAHGVFGTLVRKDVKLPEYPTLPPLVAARWSKDWGDAMTRNAAIALAAQPPLDLTLADSGETAGWAAKLDGQSLLPGHVRLGRGDVRLLPGFSEGRWWVQDIAASLPVRLLGPGNGRSVLDLCAAPGGKTLQLAAAGWQVTALDRSESRLARLSENLKRTGLQADICVGDALEWAAEAGQFDAILVDAPCSATGIFRRHPDVLHRATSDLIAQSAEIQTKMLMRAKHWLKPGGQLLYAVCSLERSEGEEVANAFLAAHPDFRCTPADQQLLPSGLMPDGSGYLRILPGAIEGAGEGAGGSDSFFIAQFQRSGP
jgi:16S rRNA (cytosine967-C5)-methyltransferase